MSGTTESVPITPYVTGRFEAAPLKDPRGTFRVLRPV